MDKMNQITDSSEQAKSDAAAPPWRRSIGRLSLRRLHKVDGWQSLGQPPTKSMIDLAA